MQQSFSYRFSAWFRGFRDKHRPRDRRSALLLFFGIVAIAFPLAAMVHPSHGAMSTALMALLIYPALPAGVSRWQSNVEGGAERDLDFPHTPLLETAFCSIAAMFDVEDARFLIRDEDCGTCYRGIIDRNGTNVQICRLSAHPVSLLWSQTWPGLVIAKTESGMAATAIDEEGRWSSICIREEELADLWSGDFRKLWLGRVQVNGRWSGYIAFRDAGYPMDDQRALQALERILSLSTRNFETQTSQRNQACLEEREHIARNLHDGVLQSLTVAEMRLEELRRGIMHAADDKTVEVLASAQNLLTCEIRKLRLQIDCLRSNSLKEPLGPYLSRLVRDFELATGISAVFIYDLKEELLSPELAMELAYLIQEGLSNVRKHSQSDRVEIDVSGQDTIQITIRDHGCGMDFSGEYSHSELQQMGLGPRVLRERVTTNGGTLCVKSSLESGTQLCICLPARNSMPAPSDASVKSAKHDTGGAPDRKGPRSVAQSRHRSALRTHG